VCVFLILVLPLVYFCGKKKKLNPTKIFFMFRKRSAIEPVFKRSIND
jgi:hypothetical protein